MNDTYTKALLKLDYTTATASDVHFLIKNGGDVNAGQTKPLAKAIKAGNLDAVSVLLHKKANCDVEDDSRHNMVLKAVKSQNLDVLTEVLAYSLYDAQNKNKFELRQAVYTAHELGFYDGEYLLRRALYENYIPKKRNAIGLLRTQKEKVISHKSQKKTMDKNTIKDKTRG